MWQGLQAGEGASVSCNRSGNDIIVNVAEEDGAVHTVARAQRVGTAAEFCVLQGGRDAEALEAFCGALLRHTQAANVYVAYGLRKDGPERLFRLTAAVAQAI